MFAISFDLTVADTELHHQKGVTQSYAEIGAVLGNPDFEVQAMVSKVSP